VDRKLVVGMFLLCGSQVLTLLSPHGLC